MGGGWEKDRTKEEQDKKEGKETEGEEKKKQSPPLEEYIVQAAMPSLELTVAKNSSTDSDLTMTILPPWRIPLG